MNLLSVRQFELVPRTKKIREFVTKRYLSKFYTIVLLVVYMYYIKQRKLLLNSVLSIEWNKLLNNMTETKFQVIEVQRHKRDWHLTIDNTYRTYRRAARVLIELFCRLYRNVNFKLSFFLLPKKAQTAACEIKYRYQWFRKTTMPERKSVETRLP